jgi:hypothetical protein
MRVERRQVGAKHCRGGRRGKDDRKQNALAPLADRLQKTLLKITVKSIGHLNLLIQCGVKAEFADTATFDDGEQQTLLYTVRKRC